MVASLPHRRTLAFYGASEEREAVPLVSTGEAALREVDPLRRRAADAYRNDPLIANAVGILRRGLLANPNPVASDPVATRAFATWARECGHKHSYGSFAAVQRMVGHHLVQDGECFVQRVWTRSPHSPNGLLLAVWPKRLVDRTRGHCFTGHEYDDGVWSGTWFQSASIEPGMQSIAGYAPVFVSRTDLIWVRYVFEGDQIEGIPRLHAALESAQQLSSYAVTALMQQKSAACLTAIALAEDSSLFGPQLDIGPTITGADGEEMSELYPGTIPLARGIRDIKVVSPSAVGGFSVERHTARVGAGAGLTGELVSGDMARTSFSAARHALLVRDEVTDELAIDFDVFRERVLEWFRDAELSVGRDWSSAAFEWLARPTPTIDPEKQAKADKIEIETGIKSRRQAISERGRDPEQVFSEIAAENSVRDADTRRGERRVA